MSDAVGSIPSFTRSGRPSFRRSSSAPSGRHSTALRVRRAASEVGSGIRPNARLPGPQRPLGAAVHRGPGRPSPHVANRVRPARDQPMSDHERSSQDPDDPRAPHARADVITPPEGYDGADLETARAIAAIYGDRPFGAADPEPEPEPEPIVPPAPVHTKIKWLRLTA